MKKVLASTLVLALLSTVSFAETPTETTESKTPIKLGPFGVTIETTEINTEEKEYIVDLGISHEKDLFAWNVKVNKTLSNFEETNSLSAGISWKF
jgi:hypothetical protein